MYKALRGCILMMAMCMIFSCGDQTPTLAKLDKQGMDAIANENDVAIKEVENGYMELLKSNAENANETGVIIGQLAHFYSEQGEGLKAAATLVSGLRTVYKSPATPDNVIQLAKIYQTQLNNGVAASALYNGYLEAYPSHNKAQEIRDLLGDKVSSCSALLETLTENIYNEELRQINTQVAKRFIGVSEFYALTNPNQEDVPGQLTKAGEIASMIKDYSKSCELYQWVYTSYPSDEKASKAMFMHGFVTDDHLEEKEKAKVLYEQFMTTYPQDTVFVAQAKFLVENLYKTDEEILKSFENK